MLNTIIDRRSVRFYKSDPVSDEEIAGIVQAGFYAPCAHGRQPWHVVVVRDEAKRKELASLHKWTKHIGFAPVALVICIEKDEMQHFWVEDASAFMTIILLEAADRSLGTCWIAVRGVVAEGVDVEQRVREICNIPNNIGVLAMTPLGAPARDPGPHTSEMPQGRIHLETFD